MNKVLLISTSIEKEHRDEVTTDNHYPLGLSYLHSYLEKKSIPVDTLFLNNINEEKCQHRIEKAIRSFNPDIVGLQMISHNRVSTYRTIEYLQKEYPNKKIILGGIHATVMYEQLLKKYPFVHCIVLGEGEETLLEIVKNKTSIENIKGISYFSNGEVVLNERRELISDLDSLPFPKHDMFLHKRKTMAGLLTSRGCPFSCSFCLLDKFSRKRVRYRSASNVVDEIEYILSNYPSVTTIWIHDDAFFLNNKRTIEFCKEVKRRNIKTNFVCSARFKPISEELISHLEEAGVRHVLFGLESGSEQILKSIHKKITKDDVRKAFTMFKNSSIKITSFLIVGLPGETEETLQETINFIKEIQAINYSYYDDVGILTPYVGTEAYDIAKQKGMIDDDYWLTDKPVPFYTAEHSLEKLNEFKETLRDHISLNRIFTPRGLKYQKYLIPSIIKYSYTFNIPIINKIVSEAVGTFGIQEKDFISTFIKCDNINKVTKRNVSMFVFRAISKMISKNT